MGDSLLVELDNNFNDFIKNGIVVVDFYADWCMPCKVLKPTLEKVAQNFAGIAKIGKLNTDNFGKIAQECSISALPTLIFFKNGIQVDKLVGLKSESEIANAIEKIANAIEN